MARSLTFQLGEDTFALEIDKVDRSKLYGDVDLETLDDQGRRCELATLARDGHTVIPYGGTAFGYVNEDGEWLERSDLTPVDLQGLAIEEVPSSFSLTLVLDTPVSIETYLDHAIRLVYQLTPAEGGFPAALTTALAQGTIYQFPFSYRGGSFADPAFLLGGEDDTVWMMIGEASEVGMVGFEQAAVCLATAEQETDNDEDDDFDFDML